MPSWSGVLPALPRFPSNECEVYWLISIPVSLWPYILVGEDVSIALFKLVSNSIAALFLMAKLATMSGVAGLRVHL